MIALGIHLVQADDADLIRDVAEGRLDSLGLLFDRYHQPLRRFLSRLQLPAGDIDDLVQVTFLQVPHAAARFDAARSARGWLFGLATMVARRHRRSIGRLARRVAAFGREPARRAPPTPAELVGEAEEARRARRALASLSAKKREVFVMVVLENLPGEAVAQALGIPVGTVWTRLHHARRDLRDLLGERQP